MEHTPILAVLAIKIQYDIVVRLALVGCRRYCSVNMAKGRGRQGVGWNISYVLLAQQWCPVHLPDMGSTTVDCVEGYNYSPLRLFVCVSRPRTLSFLFSSPS